MISARPLDVCSAVSCPLRTLYAVSVMGTKLYFYSVDTQNSDGKITMPASIPGNPTRLIDMAPKDRWALDILEPTGEMFDFEKSPQISRMDTLFFKLTLNLIRSRRYMTFTRENFFG